MKVENASQKPQMFYGLHMSPGVAEYQEPGKEAYRILVDEQAIKNMDPTFRGRPVYVEHVDKVDFKNIQTEADGYVIRSFYNEMDGKHWAEFIVVSDAGHEAIKNGWRLSNAYVPKVFNDGGLWHGVQYDKEVTMGEYDHLAIVSNPRYEESIIMTPEEFKQYNSDKDSELKKLKNSNKESTKMKLNFFKKQKVENAADFETMSVVLPKSGKEITLSKLVEDHDTVLNMHGYANGDHMVKCNDTEEMSVNDLVKKYNGMLDESAKSKDKEESPDKQEEEEKSSSTEGSEDQDVDYEKKENDDKDQDMEYEKKKNEADAAVKKAEKRKHFDKVKNAPDLVKTQEDAPRLDLTEDMIARGKTLFGK